jgi:hypothetical protein
VKQRPSPPEGIRVEAMRREHVEQVVALTMKYFGYVYRVLDPRGEGCHVCFLRAQMEAVVAREPVGERFIVATAVDGRDVVGFIHILLGRPTDRFKTLRSALRNIWDFMRCYGVRGVWRLCRNAAKIRDAITLPGIDQGVISQAAVE